MSLLNKILIIVGAILLIGFFGFTLFKMNEISNRQVAIQTQIVEQKELIDGIVRSQQKYSTKEDMEAFIKENNVNLNAIKKDLETLQAQVSAINIIEIGSTPQSQTGLPSTHTGPGPVTPTDPKNPDPYGYLTKQQKLALSENFSGVMVPFGEVGFSAWQEKPWSIDIPQRNYKVINVVGTDENNRNYFYNKVTVNVNNKDYDIVINKAETRQEYPSAKFSFWNPRLFLTAGGAVNLTHAPIQGSANAGVTLGIMSYGQFKTTPDISVLQVGASYQTGTQRPAAIVNPVSFNIGGLMPKGLVNNTFVGPSVQVDTAGTVFAGGNLSLGF